MDGCSKKTWRIFGLWKIHTKNNNSYIASFAIGHSQVSLWEYERIFSQAGFFADEPINQERENAF